MPISVSPSNRQLDTALVQCGSQGGDQFADLIIQRALSAEMVVVLGDRHESLARNVPAACDVLQKRNHVLAPFRPAESDDQNGVVLSRQTIAHVPTAAAFPYCSLAKPAWGTSGRVALRPESQNS